MSDVFGPYAVKVGDTVVGGIESHAIGCNNELGGDSTSGQVFRVMQFLRSQQLAPTFATKAIATALTAAGSMGVSLATKPLILYAQKLLDGGSRASSGHASYTMAKGMIVPQTLSVDHRGDATLSFTGIAASADGTTVPVVISASASLPALAAQDEVFTLGAVIIGGVTIGMVRSVSVDFGIRLISEGGESDPYDTFVCIEGVDPSITINTLDRASVGAAGIAVGGAAATHANTSIVLKKRIHGGSFAGSGDLTITAAGMAIASELFNATHPNRGTIGITMQCTFDGTNNPIVIT